MRDLRSGATATTALRSSNLFGDLVWLDEARVTYVNGGGDSESNVTFDPALRPLGRTDGWGSRSSDLLGARLWSVDFSGRLWRADLPSGVPRRVRSLPDLEAGPVVVVPDGPPLRGASKHVPG